MAGAAPAAAARSAASAAVSEEQQLLRENIVRFAQETLNGGVIDRDREQHFPRELWEKCGEMGLQGLPVPEKYGGSGLDALSCAVALEALGYGCHDGGLVFSVREGNRLPAGMV